MEIKTNNQRRIDNENHEKKATSKQKTSRWITTKNEILKMGNITRQRIFITKKKQQEQTKKSYITRNMIKKT